MVNSMREINFEVEFKRDWSHIEIEGVIAIIKNYSYSEGDIFGDTDSSVYTSSTSYAMLGYQDLNFASDDYGTLEIDHVAITTNDMLILVCEDEDGNHILFQLEPSDF